ncbi:MAG: hypothetical protein R3Y58_11490, partial [Eubacteriales bacterium]
DLEFVKDTRYHDPIPLILSTYTIEESESLKGSIFLAKISSDKLWGELSETYTAAMYQVDEIPDFNYYNCELSSKALISLASNHINNL